MVSVLVDSVGKFRLRGPALWGWIFELDGGLESQQIVRLIYVNRGKRIVLATSCFHWDIVFIQSAICSAL